VSKQDKTSSLKIRKLRNDIITPYITPMF